MSCAARTDEFGRLGNLRDAPGAAGKSGSSTSLVPGAATLIRSRIGRWVNPLPRTARSATVGCNDLDGAADDRGTGAHRRYADPHWPVEPRACGECAGNPKFLAQRETIGGRPNRSVHGRQPCWDIAGEPSGHDCRGPPRKTTCLPPCPTPSSPSARILPVRPAIPRSSLP